MPRPPRRAPQSRDATTTPTRPPPTNSITGAIPPFMLETPPHAPFLTSPLPPANNPGTSLVPNDRSFPNINLSSNNNHASTANGNQFQDPNQSQVPTNNLAQNMSDTEHVDEDSLLESAPHDPDDARQLAGLREISSLATWTLSSFKPGCALAQLRHPSPSYFWQSDGPQPHTLTLHFFKLVAILKMRIYLDFELDESYTPTKMKFFGGMSEGGLVEFGNWEVPETIDPENGESTSAIENIRGWVDIDLKGVGGRDTRYHERHDASRRIIRGKMMPATVSHGIDGSSLDIQPSMNGDGDELTSDGEDDDVYEDDDIENITGGDVLKAMVVQVRIYENHQNGKDTHVRGFQVFARDESGAKEGRRKVQRNKTGQTPHESDGKGENEAVGIQEADWMGEPELR